MSQQTLKVGDTVNWRGGFGLDEPKSAIVKDIEITGGWKYGYAAEEVDWDEVYGCNVVVTLDNGHWAYGEQIRPHNGSSP